MWMELDQEILSSLIDFPKDQFELNENIICYHIEKLKSLFSTPEPISALGIAFKGIPKTDDTRDSVGLKIVRGLMRMGFDIRVYDLMISREEICGLGLVPAEPPFKGEEYEGIFVLNNDPDYRDFLIDNFIGFLGGSYTLYDPWRVFVAGEESIFQKNFLFSSVLLGDN